MIHFYTPWKCQKTSGFLAFSGGIEIDHWPEMSELVVPYLRFFAALQKCFKGNQKVMLSYVNNETYFFLYRNLPWDSEEECD